MLSKVKRTATRYAVRVLGCTSAGVRIGRRYGFGSGMMLDHVCADAPRGTLGIGRVLDGALLAGHDCRAVRSRDAVLTRALREEIAVRGGEVFVLDVAAGPGRRLQDLLAEDEPGGQLQLVCRDPEPAALKRGRRTARQRRLAEGLVHQQGDPLDPAPPAGGRTPDIVVASGVYEQVPDDDVFRESLERLRTMLAPDGTLLFTTRTAGPRAELLTDVLPRRDLALREQSCRAPEEAEAWAVKAGFAADEVSSSTEAQGVFTLTRCRGNR